MSARQLKLYSKELETDGPDEGEYNMRPVFAVAAAAFMMLGPSSAFAQEGCQPAQMSCSQMKARCEQVCANEANPSRCAAARCEVALANCKANGIWSIRGAPTCWKTSNRS